MISPLIEKLRCSAEFVDLANRIVQEIPKLETKKNEDLVGRSGAKHRTDLVAYDPAAPDRFRYLFDCNLPNENLEARLEAFTKIIEDLRVERGVLFSALPPAKEILDLAAEHGIESIFLGRLSSEEMMRLPEEYFFYLLFYAGLVKDFDVIEEPGSPLACKKMPRRLPDISVSLDHLKEERLFLHSVATGRKGAHLLDVLHEKRLELLHIIAADPALEPGPEERAILVRSEVEIAMSDYDYRQLRFGGGVLNISKIEFRLETQIHHVGFHYRGKVRDQLALATQYFLDRQIGRPYIWENSELMVAQTQEEFQKILDFKMLNGELSDDNSKIKQFLPPGRNVAVTEFSRRLKTKKFVWNMENTLTN